MSQARVVAVGPPPSFRQSIAKALQAPAETIGWVQDAENAESALSGRERADLLVISPNIDDDNALALAQLAARFSPATAVVVVRDGEMNGSLPSYMRAGVRDVVDTTKGSDELSDALERAISWSSRVRAAGQEVKETGTGIVITVFSSKGGTGKTFLSCNLAAAIAQRSGIDTALVDLDTSMGDVFSYWGQEPTRPIQDLLGLGAMIDREEMLQIGTQVLDHLWAFGAPADPGAHSIDPDAIGTTINALRSNFTFTVVDSPGAYSDQILPALDASDEVCLVTGLDVVGLKHLAKATETLESLGVDPGRLHVVLNRADSKVGLDIDDVERVMNVKIDTLIPSSRSVPMSLNEGRPVVLSQPDSAVSAAITKLADHMISLSPAQAQAQDESRKSKRRLFGRA